MVWKVWRTCIGIYGSGQERVTSNETCITKFWCTVHPLHIYVQHCNVSKKGESLCHNITMHVLLFGNSMIRNGYLGEQWTSGSTKILFFHFRSCLLYSLFSLNNVILALSTKDKSTVLSWHNNLKSQFKNMIWDLFFLHNSNST